jgi:peroxiredoxin Q/BCP
MRKKKAPSFNTVTQNNEPLELKDFLGKKVALIFYPKDDSPTCTKQVCHVRDRLKDLLKYGIHPLGISPDKLNRHYKFHTKYELGFDLLLDDELIIAKKYKVYGPKKFMGKEYNGVYRTTFCINEKGFIISRIDKVNATEHVDQILEAFGSYSK